MASRPEVEWDETERGWMLGLERYRETLCPLCGGPRDECQSPEAENAYEGSLPIRCHKTTAMRRTQDARKDNKAEHPDALLWGVQARSTN